MGPPGQAGHGQWSWTTFLQGFHHLGRFFSTWRSRNWRVLPGSLPHVNQQGASWFSLFSFIVMFFLGGGGKNPGKSPVFIKIIGIGKILFLLPEWWSNDPIPRLFPKRSEVRSEQRYQASKFGRFRVWEFCCLGKFDSNSGFLPLNRNIQDRKDSNPRGVRFYFPLRDTHLWPKRRYVQAWGHRVHCGLWKPQVLYWKHWWKCFSQRMARHRKGYAQYSKETYPTTINNNYSWYLTSSVSRIVKLNYIIENYPCEWVLPDTLLCCHWHSKSQASPSKINYCRRGHNVSQVLSSYPWHVIKPHCAPAQPSYNNVKSRLFWGPTSAKRCAHALLHSRSPVREIDGGSSVSNESLGSLDHKLDHPSPCSFSSNQCK